jgi:sugar/nucleoside kinase (ribokinase family)
VYVTAGDWAGGREGGRAAGTYRPAVQPPNRPVQAALVAGDPAPDPADPTGCGDVFGAAVFARLLAGEPLPAAVAAGNRAGARNVSFRGASGLAQHLRGELVAL